MFVHDVASPALDRVSRSGDIASRVEVTFLRHEDPTPSVDGPIARSTRGPARGAFDLDVASPLGHGAEVRADAVPRAGPASPVDAVDPHLAEALAYDAALASWHRALTSLANGTSPDDPHLLLGDPGSLSTHESRRGRFAGVDGAASNMFQDRSDADGVLGWFRVLGHPAVVRMAVFASTFLEVGVEVVAAERTPAPCTLVSVRFMLRCAPCGFPQLSGGRLPVHAPIMVSPSWDGGTWDRLCLCMIDDVSLMVRDHLFGRGACLADEIDTLIEGERDDAPPVVGHPQPHDQPFTLYETSSVRHVLAQIMPSAVADEGDGRRAAVLRRIVGDGRMGERTLALVRPGSVEAISALGERAPHLWRVTGFLIEHLRAWGHLGQPFRLPPVVLVGDPGLGKSWFLSRVATLLGLPFRTYPMSMATLAEGLQGAHPTWRGAEPGLVAGTLLHEDVANPVFFVDEFDKVSPNSHTTDPYRPFYALLEPEGARAFQDEFLQFPIDASMASWVMAANDLSRVPSPVLDRLTVIEVPPPTASQMRVVVASVYAEANARLRLAFDPEPPSDVLDALCDLHPREGRKALDRAFVTAAASGRRRVAIADLPRGAPPTRRIGFGLGAR